MSNAYQEGWIARLNGMKPEVCPYPFSDAHWSKSRNEWMRGFYSEDRYSRRWSS